MFSQTYVTSRDESSCNLERELRRQMRCYPGHMVASNDKSKRVNRGPLSKMSRRIAGIAGITVAAVMRSDTRHIEIEGTRV